jgi:hypothetical protein
MDGPFHSNLLKKSDLNQEPGRFPWLPDSAPGPPARSWPAAGNWTRAAVGPRLLPGLALTLALAAAGCGGAHAPCPTPTDALDGLRAETETLDARVGQARSAERAERQRRDAAVRRAAQAQAALDSLAAAGPGR